MFKYLFLLILIKSVLISGQSIQVPPKLISEPWNYGSTCVPMSSYTDSEMANVCREYLSPYYNMTYADFLTPARLAIVQAAAQIIFILPEQCGIAGIRWICATSFPECIPDVPVAGTNGSLTVNMQKFACRSLCQDVHDLCYDAYTNIIGATPEETEAQLTCDPPGLFYFFGYTNRTIFPNATDGNNDFLMTDIPHPLNYTDPSLYWNTTSQCFDANRFLVVGDIPFTCPDQYGFTEGGEFCTFECPYPIISLNKYIFLWAWTGSLAFISLIACLIILTIYTCLAHFRRTIIMEIYNILIAVTIYSFAFVMALPIGYKEMWCDGDDPNLWGHPGCTIQGILISYSLWVIVMWWFTLILELFASFMISIFSKKNYSVITFHHWKKFKLFTVPKHKPIFITLWRKMISCCREYQEPELISASDFHFKPVVASLIILVWVGSGIPTLIALSSQHLGFSGGDAWCTIQANEEITFKRSSSGVVKDGGSDPDGWNLGLLTVPLTLVVIVGAILVLIMMIGYIVKIMKYNVNRMKEESREEGTSKKKNCWLFVKELWETTWYQTKAQKRLIFYVIVMLFIFMFNLIFRIVFSFEKPEMIDELGDTMTCYFNQISLSYIQIPGTVTQDSIDKTCKPEGLITYWLWAMNCTITGLTGLLVALIFGCNTEIPKRLWRAITCQERRSTSVEDSDSRNAPSAKRRHKSIPIGGSADPEFSDTSDSSNSSNYTLERGKSSDNGSEKESEDESASEIDSALDDSDSLSNGRGESENDHQQEESETPDSTEMESINYV